MGVFKIATVFMSVLIEWEEPQSVIDFEWRTKYAPQTKGIQRSCFLFVGAVSLPILWAVWSYEPSALLVTCVALFFTGIVFPAGLTSQMGAYKLGRRCQIGKQKLSKSYGTSKWSSYDINPFRWSEIKKYEFVDHPELPQVRQIVISHKWLRYDVIFNFAPNEVAEQHLRAIFSERVAVSQS